MSSQNKLRTYGKPNRKRQVQDLPVRSVDPYDFPADPPTTGGGNIKPPTIPWPRRDALKPRVIGSDSQNRSATDTEGAQKREPCSGDDVAIRKRKRDQPPDFEMKKNDKPTSSHRSSSVPSSKVSVIGSGGPARIGPDAKRPRPQVSNPKPISRIVNVRASPTTSTVTMCTVNSDKDAKPISNTPPSAVTGGKARASQKARRTRLIDTLTAQRAQSPETDSSSSEDEAHFLSSFSSGTQTPSQQSSQVTQESQTRLKTRPGVVLQGKRVKYTYGQSRTILNDSQKSANSGIGSQEDELDALLATPPGLSNPDPFALDDDDDEDGDLRPAIKSVHELRRAGANNRFADEMEDLLARIGTPGHANATMRRNGLLELAQKLQRKDFMSQFRDHATRDKVATHIGQEEDLVSGFALAAILIMFLSFSPAPHFLRQLVKDDLWRLLSRLLRVSRDIETVIAEQRIKFPRGVRNSLTQVKISLTGMNIWYGQNVTELSPQTVSLQLLHILCQQTDPGYSAGVVADLKGDLGSIIDRCSQDRSVTKDAIFPLVVSILETQSSLTTDVSDEQSWISQHARPIALFLRRTLQQWPVRPGKVESTVLKLAINTTNTARGAICFDSEALLSSLSSCIHAGFHSTQEAVSNQRLREETYDGLLLILGVTINILEHCPPARKTADDASVRKLINLYVENQTLMSEADSVETSQLSVAFGYLAVLLGYLSLVASVRAQLAEQTEGEGISTLIGSIQEFIHVYRSVDKVHELEGLVRELQASAK